MSHAPMNAPDPSPACCRWPAGPPTWLAALLIVGLVALAYGNSLDGPFIFDDVGAIEENACIRQAWPLTAALRTPAGSAVCGRPVANLSLALNFAAGGLAVRGYHLFNVVGHTLVALTLFGLLRRPLNRAVRSAAAAGWLAAAVAVVWAVHPLTTSTVTYVVQRTELLMALFYLLTLYCAARGFASRRPAAWWAAAVVCAALGMGCKEVMVSVPVAVLLYDRAFVAGAWGRALRRHWPLYTGLAATWFFLASLVLSADFRVKTGLGFEHFTPWDYARTQCLVLTHYLRLAAWPDRLVLDYLDWPVARFTAGWWVAACGVLAIVTTTAAGIVRNRGWAVAPAIALMVLGPTSSFLPLHGEVATERRMYLPLMAVVILVALLVEWGGRLTLARSTTRPCRALGMVAAATLALLVAVLVGTTRQRNAVYADAVTIWADAAAKRPNNHRAFTDLGVALDEAGRTAEAVPQYERALALKPDYALAHANLGVALAKLQRLPEALVHFARAVELNPQSASAHHNLGLALQKLGRTDLAEGEFRIAARLDPGRTSPSIQR